MGGNGAYDEEWGGIPDAKREYIEMDTKINGHKILMQSSNPQHKSAPENSNSASPIYLCARVNEETGVIQIHTVAFYSNHKLVKTIDLEYDVNGNLKPFATTTKKGKVKVTGTHSHNWDANDKGIVGRKSHDPKNIHPVNINDGLLIKIVEYNKKHNTWK